MMISKAILIIFGLGLATAVVGKRVKYVIRTFTAEPEDLPVRDAKVCLCEDGFDAPLFGIYNTSVEADQTLEDECECVDCRDENANELIEELCCYGPIGKINDIMLEDSLHFQLYKQMPKKLETRAKRGVFGRLLDRVSGGLKWKHNRESTADVDIGLNKKQTTAAASAETNSTELT